MPLTLVLGGLSIRIFTLRGNSVGLSYRFFGDCFRNFFHLSGIRSRGRNSSFRFESRCVLGYCFFDGNSGGGAGESSVSNQVVTEPEGEVDRLMAGDLGPVLRDVQAVFTTYVVRAGRGNDDANGLMREQMREWLLCCNPSPYTFPLLIDGLSQVLTDRQGERTNFMNDVQAAMRNSKLWAGKR